MKRLLSSVGAVVTSALVVVATLTTTATTAQAAAYDAAPVDAGAAWLTGQLTDGLMYNAEYSFNDYGLSLDTELALAEVGDSDATVQQIADAVAANIDDYTTGIGLGYPDEEYSGATSKALLGAQIAGDDPTSFGGVDLVSQLESMVSTSGPTQGRLEDKVDPNDSYDADYANTIGQAYAAQGLTAAGSADATAVTAFLLEQQCSEGWFRLSFSAVGAADQTCNDSSSTADNDVTAIAVLALLPQENTNPAAATAIENATTWLKSEQKSDGAFGGGGPTAAPNANSTGLAGYALAQTGDTAAASKAAGWVRAHQAADVAPCTTKLTTEAGAVGYDNAGVAAGRKHGIGVDTADQWRRASAQALPVLLYTLPSTGTLKVRGPSGYLRAGSTPTFTVAGLAPGERTCVNRSDSGANASSSGVAKVAVTLGGGTGSRVYTAYNSDKSAHATTAVTVLGKSRFAVKVGAKKVWRRHLETVTARGLASHEKVTLYLHGKVVKHSSATAAGTYRTKLRVGKKAGRAVVKVAGQFPSLRFGRIGFTVR